MTLCRSRQVTLVFSAADHPCGGYERVLIVVSRRSVMTRSAVAGLSFPLHICCPFFFLVPRQGPAATSGRPRGMGGGSHVHSLALAGVSALLRRAVRRVRRGARRRSAPRPAVVLAPRRACYPARLPVLPPAQPGVRRL